jgi:hypothetical protein
VTSQTQHLSDGGVQFFFSSIVDYETRAKAFKVKSDHAKEAGSRPDARA